jgi:sugar lactone lactonase YvrE
MNDDKTPGDGVVKVLEGDRATDFATGLDEPKGICFTGKFLVTTDLKKVWRIDTKGEKAVLAEGDAFPHPVSYLNDMACEAGGKSVLVTDMGANTKMRDPQGNLWPLDGPEAKALPALGRVYRIGLDGKVTLVLDTSPHMKCPNGVSAPTKDRVLVAEFFTGNLLEARDGKLTILASGYRGADAIEQDRKGNLYVSSWTQGKVWRIGGLVTVGKGPPPRMGETVLLEGLQSAADFFLDEKGQQLVVPDMKAGALTFLPLPKPGK